MSSVFGMHQLNILWLLSIRCVKWESYCNLKKKKCNAAKWVGSELPEMESFYQYLFFLLQRKANLSNLKQKKWKGTFPDITRPFMIFLWKSHSRSFILWSSFFSDFQGNGIQTDKRVFTKEMKISLYKESLQSSNSFSHSSSFSRPRGESSTSPETRQEFRGAHS